MRDDVLISAGDVLEVQLTSETVLLQTAAGRRPFEQGHITNRMRLFVRELSGPETRFDFEDTDLGVRQTQRVAIVRAKFKAHPDPINLMIFNLSSGEMDTFEPALEALLGRTPLFGPRWKAFFAALLAAAATWLLSRFALNQSAVGAGFIAAAVTLAVYPLTLWGARTWDRVTEDMRYRNARKRFIEEMWARVKAYAPRDETPPQTE